MNRKYAVLGAAALAFAVAACEPAEEQEEEVVVEAGGPVDADGADEKAN